MAQLRGRRQPPLSTSFPFGLRDWEGEERLKARSEKSISGFGRRRGGGGSFIEDA